MRGWRGDDAADRNGWEPRARVQITSRTLLPDTPNLL